MSTRVPGPCKLECLFLAFFPAYCNVTLKLNGPIGKLQVLKYSPWIDSTTPLTLKFKPDGSRLEFMAKKGL